MPLTTTPTFQQVTEQGSSSNQNLDLSGNNLQSAGLFQFNNSVPIRMGSAAGIFDIVASGTSLSFNPIVSTNFLDLNARIDADFTSSTGSAPFAGFDFDYIITAPAISIAGAAGIFGALDYNTTVATSSNQIVSGMNFIVRVAQPATHLGVFCGITGGIALGHSTGTLDFARLVNVRSQGVITPAQATVVAIWNQFQATLGSISATGVIGERNGFMVENQGTINGVLTTQNGLNVEELTGATNNREIFLQGGGEIFFRDNNHRMGSTVSGQLDIFVANAFQINGGHLYLPADNQTLFLGDTGSRAAIYHDGTDLIIDSTNAGTGVTRFKSDSSGDVVLDRIGLGGSPITTFFWINYVLTTSQGRGALNFDYTYTGAGPQANILTYPTYQGTSATPLCIGIQTRNRDNSDHTGTGNYICADLQYGSPVTNVITQGTKNFIGVRVQHNQGVGGANTGGTIRKYGIQILGFSAYAGVAADYDTGIYSEEDIGVKQDVRFNYNDTSIAHGDTYTYYDSAATELKTYVGGNQMIRMTANSWSVFGGAPAVQQVGGAIVAGAAYTAVEQGMINTMWNGMRAYGLLT